MPKRARSGDVRSPLRVVAPIRVKGERLNCTDRAPDPCQHYIYTIVFHCRIEIFFYNGAQAMDFINKQHIVFFERSEYSRKITGFVAAPALCYLEADAKLIGDDLG